MRDDYFTMCEVARVARVDPQRMKAILGRYDDSPTKRVGGRYVIPKAQFFKWYDTHKNDDGLMYCFDDSSIEGARTEFVLHRNKVRLYRGLAR